MWCARACLVDTGGFPQKILEQLSVDLVFVSKQWGWNRSNTLIDKMSFPLQLNYQSAFWDLLTLKLF
ncbi:MAG: hypothetical protein CMN21_18645 [Rubinisphaera sp.]|nr:hypothetical protein [Rubinisphaera sp.]|tara:strand:- start:3840 stop:4040 length:201 start_codon:yes stop_codon:yes gene_type:complete